MPKPILNPQQLQAQAHDLLSTTSQESRQQQQKIDKLKLDRLLRQPRSKAYMEAIQKLDAGGHVHNHDAVQNIINIIRSELPEVELGGDLLGYVAICYLGRPYEAHVLDITGEIIRHYKAGEALPNGMERARGIAMRGRYAFIEVYTDCCRAVSDNGTVSVIVG